MLKIITVVGARPQFIKAAAVSRAIRNNYANDVCEIIVHTGQHYDSNMSQVFFDELDIPHPKFNLEISGGNHGAMTGRMLEAIENVCIQEKPDWVLIYGDTNSTLAAALAAVKLHIPVAHVEAGLRSFNMRMPEEINRIVSDRISNLLFCPTEVAVKNLASEGLTEGVHNVGDVMFDVALYYRDVCRQNGTVLQKLGLPRAFALATCHRAENTDNPGRLHAILAALNEISRRLPVVLPIHPRTEKSIAHYGLRNYLDNLLVVKPLPFLEMVTLEQAASVILTDSGGVQKEAYFYGVPCVTMRDETEWVETVTLGKNTLVGASEEAIISAAWSALSKKPLIAEAAAPYGRGDAATRIVEEILSSGITN